MKIKKGDNVIVIAGKNKGKKAKVLKAFPKLNKVLVEGVNMLKKHTKSKSQDKKGEVIEVTMPIHVSNVMILDPKTDKGTRVGFKVQDNKKVRVAVKSGQKI